ncbi:MAG: hypothetical protein IKT97_07420, partial [Spirochaetia bacterium]|nr:hypothetical protein [Spirochaetia bacterium]
MDRKKDIPSLLITGLLFYRILMAFLAKFVIARFTILGDIETFMYGEPVEEYGTITAMFGKYGLLTLFKKDELGIVIISLIHKICHFELLTFCVCAVIGYIGIRKFLVEAKSSSSSYLLLILLCYSPSFNIWSS